VGGSYRSLTACVMHKSLDMCGRDVSCANVLDFRFKCFRAERPGDRHSEPF